MGIEDWRGHLRQTSLFLVVGLAQLAIDTGVFIGSTRLGLAVVAGNLLGRVSGASLGFWLNGRYTFGTAKLDWRHATRFGVAWSLLTILSTVLIGTVAAQLGLHTAWLAKPLVEAVLAAINFAISRQWIYR
jgi:putative flippase GtrA